MNTAPRMHAAEELRHYLQKLDWSGLTPGRSRILEAFIELASAEGYSSVSMRSLGRKVNMKAPSIYSHFPGGRDEVVAEAFRWHFSRFAAAVLEAVDGADNPSDFWDAIPSEASASVTGERLLGHPASTRPPEPLPAAGDAG